MTVTPTAVYQIYKAGNNNNGGGYDAGISGAGTDYSQQSSAQASGVHGTATGSTTFVDATANAFTAAMIGNSINITSGSGFTAGVYFITARSSASTVTLDRSPGTGTVAIWTLGGAWADFWTNNNSAWVVPGNTLMVQGGGTDTPVTSDYTYNAGGFTWPVGDNTNGMIRLVGFNGRPMVAVGSAIAGYPGTSYQWMENFYFQTTTAFLFGTPVFLMQDRCTTYNCVFDQNGYDTSWGSSQGVQFTFCEFFSNQPARSGVTPSSPAFTLTGNMNFCLIHDNLAQGIQATLQGECWMDHCIIANNGAEGCAVVASGNVNTVSWWSNNTFSGNGGNGGLWLDSSSFELVAEHMTITNNIFANHTAYGVLYTSYGGLTPAQNGRRMGMFAGNAFYNNGTNISGITLPAVMANLNTYGINPGFTSLGTENFGVSGTGGVYNLGLAMPINRLSGMANTVVNNTPGAATPAVSGGTTVTYVINKVTNISLAAEI